MRISRSFPREAGRGGAATSHLGDDPAGVGGARHRGRLAAGDGQAIRPATWKRVNELLGQKAAAEQVIGTATIRTDTTVVETNIHWPTDASLLWDAWRVASRLLRRGRREKPVEFGHAMLLCQTPEKFITDYEVFAERPADCTLTGQVIERHEKLFGQRPEVLAADKVLRAWQAFRAGIEGTISGLKRDFFKMPGQAYLRGKSRCAAFSSHVGSTRHFANVQF